MARNLRPRSEVVVVADGSAYVIDPGAGTVAPYPEQTITTRRSAPACSSGRSTASTTISGYFVFSPPNGEIVASELQSTEFGTRSRSRGPRARPMA